MGLLTNRRIQGGEFSIHGACQGPSGFLRGGHQAGEIRSYNGGMRVIARYIAFNIPGLVLVSIVVFLLQHWNIISVGLAWLLLALWMIKDAVLFPFTRTAYEDPPSSGPQGLVGSEGVASTDLDPKGLVVVQGERWQAFTRDGGLIERHRSVRVCDTRGIILVVERMD